MTGNPVNVHAVGTVNSSDNLMFAGSVGWENWYFLVTTGDSLKVLKQFVIPEYLMYDCTVIKQRPGADQALFYYPGNFIDFVKSGHNETTPESTPGELFRIDLNTGEYSILLDESDFEFIYIRDLLITPDGGYAYVVTYDKVIKIDLATGDKKRILTDRNLGVYSIAVRPR